MIDTCYRVFFQKATVSNWCVSYIYILNADGKKYNNINMYAFIMERSIEGGNQEKNWLPG